MALGKVPGEPDDPAMDAVFADINITPLTDIFLVLLIIFMVTSSAMVESSSGAAGMKVDLPKGGATDITASQTDLAIAILQDGRVVIGGKVVDGDALGEALATAARTNPNTLVILQADTGVPHGKVVEVMERSKQAGLQRLAIGTRAEGQ